MTAPPSAAHRDAPRCPDERRRSGRSPAPPVERVGLDKDDGTPRPIGPPPCEEHLVQRAVVRRWEAIDAQACCDSASGFRQGRSPPDARDAGRARCMTAGSGGSVEADGGGEVDRLDKTRRRDRRRQRVKEGSSMRRSGQWRRAGGMDAGVLPHPETGVPPGGVTTPRAEVPMLALPSFLPGKTRFLECRLYGPCWVRCPSETPWGPSRWRRWWAWPPSTARAGPCAGVVECGVGAPRSGPCCP